jgi:TonB family protein
MFASLHRLIATVWLQAVFVYFVGCTAPQATQPVPSGSAAFVSFDEPWQKDLVRSVAPVYSFNDRRWPRQGGGLFHLLIDWSTGSVVQVTVKKSTGHATLDNAAVRALKQWRFRPGSWKALDVPVNFTMTRSHVEYRENVRNYQQQWRQL